MRDEKNIIIPTQYTFPEFEYLKDNKFECTEKIDGTNIRVELSSIDNNVFMEFKGRTDNAQIPNHLFNKLNQMFSLEKLIEVFDYHPETSSDITIFGEGYGYKIQKGGNYIENDVDFILFDIKIGHYWLSRESIEAIANLLNIKVVPILGYMTIPEAIEYVKKGFKSTIAQNKDYDAEGLVLKTPNGLLDRKGDRIITKIKTVDFLKYKQVYG